MKPANLAIDQPNTDTTKITLVMTAVTGTNTGGSTIVSYSLEWDSGTSGATFTSLIGESSNNIQLTYSKTSLSAGQSYRFRYRAKNIFGWSPYSEVITALAATVPEAPAMATTVNTGTSVRIDWVIPYNGGSTITAYNVQIQKKNGDWIEELTYCAARSDSTVIANRYCVIPIATLSASPYLLVQGDIVKVRVLAQNAIGDSSYSTVNTLGADIRVAPLTPLLAPYRGSLTTITQIQVLVAQITGAQTGGSPITSYYIEFNDGTSWSELQGYTTQSLDLTALKTGLTTGVEYSFSYSAKNLFGWSPVSAVGLIKTIQLPSQVSIPTVAYSGDLVKISWALPDLGGSTLAQYLIQIRGKDTLLYTETANCDGTVGSIKSSRECLIPMSLLWTSPFNLLEGDLIQVKVAAKNELDFGLTSDQNLVGATVRTKPQIPTTLVSRVEDQCTTTTIAVEMPEVTTSNTGGADIISYNLEWNQGSGTTFYEIIGETTNNMVRIATQNGLTSGSLYSFRYRVKNIYGFSVDYSPVADIYCAKVPDTPATPVLSNSGTDVVIDWTASGSNFSPINAYKIEFQAADGINWHQDLVNCDGTDSDVKTNTICTIAMNVFRSSPFNLVLNQPILVRISAQNEIGFSSTSTLNAATTLVQTVPTKPSLPYRGPNTNTAQIDLRWTGLTTSAQNGGSAITSYHVIHDDGTNGVTWSEMVGLTSPFTGTQYPFTGRTSGTRYMFKIRAQNIHGWGEYSEVASVLAATVPSQMQIPTVTDNSD